jgi:hypothetical protein
MLHEESYTALPQAMETLTALLYRMASYATTHLVDDAAILALVFC